MKTHELTLKRLTPWPRKALLGNLIVPTPFGFNCNTLEDALVLDPTLGHGSPVGGFIGRKIPGLTAIPAGRYRVLLAMSNRFQRVLPRLLDVPGFTGILIHNGSYTTHTEGCILVGRRHSDTMLTGSKVSMAKLMAALRELNKAGELWITITNPEVG